MKISDKLQQQILRVVREVGDYQMKMRGTAYATQDKEDLSPVTEIDLYSHRQIKAVLKNCDDKIKFFSEESTEKQNFEIKTSGPFWCVDPLDGTRDYIEGSPTFAINIALFEHGQVQWGLVHHPATRETLIADRSKQEIYFISEDDSQKNVEIPFTSDRIKNVLTSARVQMDEQKKRQIKTFAPHLDDNAKIIPLSSSYKFFWLFKRQAEAYVRKAPCMIWDIAPGFLAAEIAGMSILDLTTTKPFAWPVHSLDLITAFAIFAPKEK